MTGISPQQQDELRIALRPPKPEKAEVAADRVAVVSRAISRDPELHGQGHIAMDLLADDDLAQLSGGAIVKLLKIKARASSAESARHDLRTAIAQSRGMTLAQWEAKLHDSPPPVSTHHPDQVWARAYAAVAR